MLLSLAVILRCLSRAAGLLVCAPLAALAFIVWAVFVLVVSLPHKLAMWLEVQDFKGGMSRWRRPTIKQEIDDKIAAQYEDAAISKDFADRCMYGDDPTKWPANDSETA